MTPFRKALPGDLLAQMQQKLGREETLRLLWPMVVGTELGARTRLVSFRQNRLRIAVPDATWKRTLWSLEHTVLEAVGQVLGEDAGRSIELVEDPALSSPRQAKEKPATIHPANLPDLPLDGIRDAEIVRMFQQSAQKYFARTEEGRK